MTAPESEQVRKDPRPAVQIEICAPGAGLMFIVYNLIGRFLSL